MGAAEQFDQLRAVDYVARRIFYTDQPDTVDHYVIIAAGQSFTAEYMDEAKLLADTWLLGNGMRRMTATEMANNLIDLR